MRKTSTALALILMSKRMELRPDQRTRRTTLRPEPKLKMKTAALVQRMNQAMSQKKLRPIQIPQLRKAQRTRRVTRIRKKHRRKILRQMMLQQMIRKKPKLR